MKKNRHDRWKELAKVSIFEVASIAANFPLKIPAVDAVRRAFELLEWAAAGKEGFDNDDIWADTAEAGLEAELEYRKNEKNETEVRKKSLKPKLIDPNFSLKGVHPYPFDAVLSNLMGRVKKLIDFHVLSGG